MADPTLYTVHNDYLNRTVNKDRRAHPATPRNGVIKALGFHETESPGYRDPHNTLEYNLHQGPVRGKRGSFNWLVGYDGSLWHYVLEEDWIAWHAGNSAWRGYQDEDLSGVSIGIEWDLPGDGTPPSDVQWAAGLWLVKGLGRYWRIPLDLGHCWEHRRVALPPGRKHDPEGYTVAELLTRLHAAP